MVDKGKVGITTNIKQSSTQVEISSQAQGAFYLYQGTPQKQIKEGENQAIVSAPLFELDIKFDSLKSFLSNISTVVNNHASLLNTLQMEVNSRFGAVHSAFDNKVGDCFVKFAQSTILYDNDLSKLVHHKLDKPKSENTGNFLEDSCHKFCNKLPGFGHAITHNYTRIKDLEHRVTKNEADIQKKVDHEEFKRKVKKTKKKLHEKIDHLEAKHEKMIHDVEHRINSRISHFENRVNEVEKNTLWKIKDCEELLKIRVNEEYVIDAIRVLEERILREFKHITQGENEHIEKIVKELHHKIKKMDDDFEDKIKKLNKDLKEKEEEIKKRTQNENFVEFKKHNDIKIEDLNNKIKEMIKKFEHPIEKLNGDVGGIHGKLSKFELWLKEHREKMDLLDVKIDSKSMHQVVVQETHHNVQPQHVQPQVDLSKLYELEVLVKRLRDELSRQGDRFSELENTFKLDLNKKLDVSVYNLTINRKIERDEVLKLFQEMQFDDDKYKQLLKAVEDLSRRFESINESIDKKFIKFRKEIDLNAVFKLLKVKAEEEDVQKGFINVDTKINALSDILNALKKEIEGNVGIVRKLRAMMMKTSDMNALLSTKAMPLTCLSCGRGDAHFVPPVHYIKGNDGKFYRTDAKATTTQQNELDEYDTGIDYYADPKHTVHVHKYEDHTNKHEGHSHKHEANTSVRLNESMGTFSNRASKPKIDNKQERPQTAQAQTRFSQNTVVTSQVVTTTTVNQQSNNRVIRPTSAKK